MGAACLAAACASSGAAGGGARVGPGAPAGRPAAAGAGSAAECPPATGRSGVPAELRVAAPGPIAAADVPSPRSAAERIAFRQMYGTLLRADCAGSIRPGLADSWRSTDGGHRWTFHLRGTARFWDGTQVTAGDVVWSWRRLSESRTAPGAEGGLALDGRTLLDMPPALPDSLVAVDAATLEVYYGDAPSAAAFADPRLAVLRAGAGRWPLGSGPLRPMSPSGADSGSLVLGPALGPGSTVILLSGAGGPAGNERDLLDAGVDVVVTSDPRTRRYAETLPGYAVLPEPWSRTYALAVPRAPAGDGGRPDTARADIAAAGARAASDALDALRASLARDAVREEAVPAAPLAWRTLPSCASAPPVRDGRRGGRPSRLAYSMADGPARDLADRLVALASSPPGTGPEGRAASTLLGAPQGLDWRTLPLVARVLEVSVRAAEESAYIVTLPRRVLDPCAARRALAAALPWLAREGELVPLVDTRPAVLVRDEVAGLTVDFDGTPRLDHAGQRPGGGGRP